MAKGTWMDYFAVCDISLIKNVNTKLDFKLDCTDYKCRKCRSTLLVPIGLLLVTMLLMWESIINAQKHSITRLQSPQWINQICSIQFWEWYLDTTQDIIQCSWIHGELINFEKTYIIVHIYTYIQYYTVPALLWVSLLTSQCSCDFSQTLWAVLTTQALSDHTSFPEHSSLSSFHSVSCFIQIFPFMHPFLSFQCYIPCSPVTAYYTGMLPLYPPPPALCTFTVSKYCTWVNCTFLIFTFLFLPLSTFHYSTTLI